MLLLGAVALAVAVAFAFAVVFAVDVDVNVDVAVSDNPCGGFSGLIACCCSLFFTKILILCLVSLASFWAATLTVINWGLSLAFPLGWAASSILIAISLGCGFVLESGCSFEKPISWKSILRDGGEDFISLILIDKIEFPSPNKKLQITIPNEDLRIVK